MVQETVDDLIAGFEKSPEVTKLGELSDLCNQMVIQNNYVEDIEGMLKTEKAKLHELRTMKIPPLMTELGLKELALTTGAVISIARQVSCKTVPEKRADALDWLDANGFSDIISREVGINFNKGQEERASLAATLLMDAGFEPFMSKDVHHATLSAWGRKQVDAQLKAKPGEKVLSIPGDLFTVDFFDIAKVK